MILLSSIRRNNTLLSLVFTLASYSNICRLSGSSPHRYGWLRSGVAGAFSMPTGWRVGHRLTGHGSSSSSQRDGALSTVLMMSTMTSQRDPSRSTDEKDKQAKPTPITVLSGFLGAGKTTFLHHTLTNQKGHKFGLVVNDMATVNVDAKQIRSQTFDSIDGIDTMELQDGCVCCTLAEDLIASVSKLVSLSDIKGTPYDHIVVECSGIAEPRKIRDLFQQAEDYGFELLKKIRLDTLITLVDATVFLQLFGTDQDISKNKRLAFSIDAEAAAPAGGGMYSYTDGADQRKVTDLLLEQVECADIVLINKCDLLESSEDVELVKKVIASINPTARVITCVKGNVPDPLSLVGSANAEGATNWGVLDEQRNLVKAVELSNAAPVATAGATTADCADPTCSDPSHDHNHSHSHSSSHSEECKDTTCTDPSHNHDHSNSQAHSHSHSHSTESTSAEAAAAVACEDATCKDPTHNHDHSHSHGNADMTTAQQRFGITSFVYKRRRPFHPIRFSLFLQGLGKLSVKGMSDWTTNSASTTAATEKEGAADDAVLLQAKRALLRSKGFVWMGTSAAAGYFMSHAGQFLELMVIGRWWADIDRKEWPAGLEQEITVDFNGAHGDRRQELVFIGQFGTTGGQSQKALEEVLDACLLTDEEMRQYEEICPKGDDALRDHFVPNF